MKSRKLLLRFASFFLVLVLGFSLVSYASASGLPATNALRPPAPPSIMPVVIVSGSDYEMGYQYGQQAGQFIEGVKEYRWSSALKSFSYDQVCHELKATQHYIKEYAPELIDAMKGIAAGAAAAGYDISYIDILLINTGLFKLPGNAHYPSPVAELPPEQCSIWSAWGATTADGSLLCADSRDATFIHQVALVAFPDKGENYILTCRAGEVGNHLAINSKGVFLGLNAAQGLRDIDKDYGIPFQALCGHLIRFAKTATEAKDMYLPWKTYFVTGGMNLHFSDISGNAFVVEGTAALKHVRTPGYLGETDFIFSTNDFLISKMKCAGKWKSNSSPSRNKEIFGFLSNYQGKVDVDFAKMMWRHTGYQQICHQSNMDTVVALPREGDKGVLYICTGPASRKTGRGYWQIAPTHSFFKLNLASSPEAVVKEAKKAANDTIGTAHLELQKLDFKDTPYAALNEIFAQAVTEYYAGVNKSYKGQFASGNEALFYYSQAATAFARCQAHALQVYNALVSPATNPEGLGLKPLPVTLNPVEPR